MDYEKILLILWQACKTILRVTGAFFIGFFSALLFGPSKRSEVNSDRFLYPEPVTEEEPWDESPIRQTSGPAAQEYL